MGKKSILTLLILTIAAFCYGNSNLQISNNSGHDVYVYDWDTTLSPAVGITPLTDANPLKNGDSFSLPMKEVANPKIKDGRRIYFANQRLNNSLERKGTGLAPAMPDAFTPWYDGDKMYSFVEYLYEPAQSRYNIDLSYIDDFSYPVTIKFSGCSYVGFEENFEYGFTSLDSAVNALKEQATYSWGSLVWPTNDPSNPLKYAWPKNIYRIIGPNKVWTSQSFGLSGYAPDSYKNFVSSLPFNGTQLFDTQGNFAGWQNLVSEPSSTGYVKALHSISPQDKNGKYGFFTYCRDNTTGEFTWVPTNAQCTLTIYPYDQ